MITFPIKISNDGKDKKPLVSGWQKLTESVAHNGDNFGVLVPDGFLVIDNDWYKHEEYNNADDAIQALRDEYKVSADWDGSKFQTTGRGGAHHVFKMPKGFNITNGTDIFENVAGFDVRTAGGFIATGKGYEPLKNDPFIDAPELPQKIARLIGTKATSNDKEINEKLNGKMLNHDGSDIEVSQLEQLLADILANDPNAINSNDVWEKLAGGISIQFDNSDEAFAVFDNACSKCSGYDAKANKTRYYSFNKNTSNKRMTTFRSVVSMSPLGLPDKKDAPVYDSGLFDDGEPLEVDTVEEEGEEALIDEMKRIAKREVSSKEEQREKIEALHHLKSKVVAIREAKKAVKPEPVSGLFYKDYVMLSDNGKYMNIKTKARRCEKAFNQRYFNMVGRDSDGKRKLPVTVAREMGVPVVDGQEFMPGAERIFKNDVEADILNTFTPWPDVSDMPADFEYKTKAVDALTRQINNLIESDREKQIILSYLAHNVQYPGRKIPWMIVLQGIQGDGKSFFGYMMKYVMGGSNSKQVNPETIKGRFNGWAADRCMNFIEEIYLVGAKFTIMNSLKPVITNTTVEIERKGVDTVNVDNMTNYFATTNFRDAIPLDDEDRRYCVIFSKWQDVDKFQGFLADNPCYFSDLHDDLRGGAPVRMTPEARKELIHYFTNYKIPTWFNSDNRAPMTDAKRVMIGESLTTGALALDELIKRYGSQCWSGDYLNLNALTLLAKKEFGDERDSLYDEIPKSKALSYAMGELGFNKVNGRRSEKIHNGVSRMCSYYVKGGIAKIDDVPKKNWQLDIKNYDESLLS